MRRSALGPEMRAQSSGEWPGVRITLRVGFGAFAECVGGGAREEPREEELPGAGPRFGTGPRARWGEFIAGKAARRGGTGPRGVGAGGGIMLVEVVEGGGGGGMLPLPREDPEGEESDAPREGGAGAFEGSSSVKEGTEAAGAAGVAFGVVCSSVSGSVTMGGAGIAGFGEERRMAGAVGGEGIATAAAVALRGAGPGAGAAMVSSGRLRVGGGGALRGCSLVEGSDACPFVVVVEVVVFDSCWSLGGGGEEDFDREEGGRSFVSFLQARRKGGMKG